VLIYFGYPAAHEDDAERAVRSGLALIDAVATLPAPEPLQVRIGAATGMLHDPATMPGNCWIDDLAPEGLQGC